MFLLNQFVERLKAKAPTKEMKLQLLQDLAQEFSINWDIKALEPKLYTSIPKQVSFTLYCYNRLQVYLSNIPVGKWKQFGYWGYEMKYFYLLKGRIGEVLDKIKAYYTIYEVSMLLQSLHLALLYVRIFVQQYNLRVLKFRPLMLFLLICNASLDPLRFQNFPWILPI